MFNRISSKSASSFRYVIVALKKQYGDNFHMFFEKWNYVPYNSTRRNSKIILDI